jgi:Replication-relaxation
VGGSIVIESKKGRRARGRSAEAKRADALAAVTEFDRQLLILLSAHRVLTQTQLERLHPDVAVRTLRYRTERLERLGLVGRSRPYREKGSAPFHLWPTRRADAFVRAEPVAAGGERPEPNPLFLAHAAALSELYVALATQAHVLGLRLRSYDREGDAREPFTTLGRKRALAPDVLLDLEDERSQRLLAFVELDLGTMSHARLKTKAAGYAGYAAEAAWTHQHPYCPCLLFLTTSDARAYRFLKTLQAGLETADHERGGRAHVDWFAAGACALAHEPERALTEACWDDLTLSGGGLGLRACLEAARAPFDERRAREEAKRRAREQQLARLRADPSTLRAHLRERRCADLHHRLGRFGEDGQEALYLLLDSERPLSDAERQALAALADYLGEELLEWDYSLREKTPRAHEAAAVARLVEQERARELARVETLARQYGELPSVRLARRQLTSAGKLLGRYGTDTLAADMRSDLDTEREQANRRERYLAYREREARRRARQAGLAARLRHGRQPFAAAIDYELVRECKRCAELIYPDPGQRDGYGRLEPATSCPYCRHAGQLHPLADAVPSEEEAW